MRVFVDRKTIEYVNALFKLPANGTEQDWPIELSDALRVMEFIEVLQRGEFPFRIRYAIIELIFASYDDFLDSKEDDSLLIWDKISDLVSQDSVGYREIIEYWALRNEKDSGNLFNIMALVRQFGV
jgi:hypothetical protein